jgi:hypothetical protein
MLALWVDEQRGGAQPSARAAWLDESMRAAVSFELTQQGELASELRLGTWGERNALLYGQVSGSAPGLFLRTLDSEGRASLRAARVTESRSSAVHPAFVRSDKGDSWVVFADDPDKASSNIYARPLDSNQGMSRPTVQLTRFAGVHGPVGPRATAPSAAVVGGQLLIAYRIERGQEHDTLFHRVGLSDPQLVSGVGEWERPPRDLVVGSVTRLSQSRLKMQPPEMACHSSRCVVTWKSEPKGVHVVGVEPTTGEVQWRKVVSAAGSQPSVGLDDKGNGLMAWHEDGRLKVAPLDGETLGAVSSIGQVRGDQPNPWVSAAGGGWVVSWTSFEAGHPEPYVARVTCQ